LSLLSVHRLRPPTVSTDRATYRQGSIEYSLQFQRCPASSHPVEWCQCKLQAELLFVAFRTGGQELKRLQTPREQADGILVRIDALCHCCRTLIIGERLLDHACALVMRRNLATDRVEVRSRHGFQRLRDATVQHTAQIGRAHV